MKPAVQGSVGANPVGDDRLRVAIVVEPGLDGVYRHVEGLVSYLSQQPVRISLAYSSRRCGDAMRQLVERVREQGGAVMDLRVSNVPTPRDAVALARLVAFLRHEKVHVVHSHSSKAGVLGRAAATILGLEHCFYAPHAYYGMGKPLWPKVLFFNKIEQAFGRIGRTIAISADESRFGQEILKIPADHISVVPNPVDSVRFQPATPEQRRAARVKFGIPDKAIVLGTVGRMCWQKDPETAYAGVAPVSGENDDLLFFHLGWGKWREYLLGFAKKVGLGEHLRIIDYTDNPIDFYHAIDGLLVSSRYEAGWSLVFLEALACNLPIITSTCIGMSDVADAGLSHVWTFAPENVADCTDGVREWLAAVRRGIGRSECNHRQYAVDRLSPERTYGAVYSLLRSALPARTA